MKTLNVGAIGCGYWGPNMIRNFVEIPSTTLTAVADLNPARLDHMHDRYPQIKTLTENYHDFFELGLDAVVISTPPPTHYAIARDCLEHGLHVLVEKPLATNSEDVRSLIRLAEKHDRILMVGHTFQYNPAVHALKKMIDSDELGDIYYIDAVRASLGLFHPTLNVIWDLAPHDISILLHLLGDSPATVSARGAACVQESVADVAYMSLMFPKSVLAHIRMSWLDPLKTRRITVIGSKKMVVYDDVDNQEKIKVYDKRVSTIRRTDTFGDFQFAYHYGNIVSPFIHLEEPLRVECLHFAECIRENKTPLTDGLNGLRVVEIIEAAQRSLKNFGVEEAVSTTGGQSVNGRSNTTLSQTHPKAAIAVPGK